VFVSGVLLVSGVPVEVVVEGLAAFEGLAVVDMDDLELIWMKLKTKM
jgi:hypothetical protein